MDILVRRAGVDDLDALSRLFDAYRQFYDQAPDLARARAFMAERLAVGDSVVFVAERGGLVVGFTQLYPTFTSVGLARTFILNDLFVDPAVRKSGAGRALLEAAAEYGRSEGAARLSLSTGIRNSVAQGLYEHMGWRRSEAFLVYNLPL